MVPTLWGYGCTEAATFIDHLGQWHTHIVSLSNYIILVINNVIIAIIAINTINPLGF